MPTDRAPTPARSQLAGRGHGRRRRQHRRHGPAATRGDGSLFDTRTHPRRAVIPAEFTFGHVRQLDAVAPDFAGYPIDPSSPDHGPVLVDLDDTLIEVHATPNKDRVTATPVRGLNALITTVSTEHAAPVILGQRLRKGSCGSPRGAARIVSDTLATLRRPRSTEHKVVLLRVDSAFYGYLSVTAAIRGGAEVSITVRLYRTVKTAIAAIDDQDWTPIEYTDAVYDENTLHWISRAEVAEIAFTAFSSRRPPSRYRGG